MYHEAIKRGIETGMPGIEIAKKLFLYYPTHVFVDKLDNGYAIASSIASYFRISITDIQVVGSSKFGFSFFKNRSFQLGESDLDIAIINADLFKYYSELVFDISQGFSDNRKFLIKDSGSNLDRYKQYISRGIFRPDLMPTCEAKKKWFGFFNTLTNEHINTFKNINAGIYLSQTFFAHKQAELVADYKTNNPAK